MSFTFPLRYANGGSLGWEQNHAALANGNNNLWALHNSPFANGYYKREDLPTHFALAEGWTMADMYAEAVISSTNPNRGKRDSLPMTFSVSNHKA